MRYTYFNSDMNIFMHNSHSAIIKVKYLHVPISSFFVDTVLVTSFLTTGFLLSVINH